MSTSAMATPSGGKQMQRVYRRLWRITPAGWRQWFLDALSWAAAVFVAGVLRYDFNLGRINLTAITLVILVAAATQLLAGVLGRLYQGRYTPGSLEEVWPLSWVMLVQAVVLGLACVLFGSVLSVPRSLVILAAPFAICLMLMTRYLKRVYMHRGPSAIDGGGRHTLILGAGSLGEMILLRLLGDTRSPYRPVGFIDDDPAKANLSIKGIHVLGALEDLAQIAPQVQASVLLVAVAEPNAQWLSRIIEIAAPLNLDVKVVPTIEDTLGGRPVIGQVRDIAVEDLIRRDPVDLDISSIAEYLTGKRVLVTGAGGSIGQELCIQIKKFSPQSLIMLDHDETHLQDTEFALYETGLLIRPEIVLADIRDQAALGQAFERWKPQVVFHAAALKHVPMLQSYPQEAWQTNVLGTLNVLRCAQAVGTEVFVNISTDKAADPTTVLGHSKRLAERLTSWMGGQTGMRYCSVRFGNVFGSRGSVVPLFQKSIERGVPIRVTDANVTRYFMTIPEACQLVVQAGATGSRGDVMILDMGTPVRIIDIVRQLVEISGKDCKVEFTGLREGEKLHEILLSSDERDDISDPLGKTVRAIVPPMPPEDLDFEIWRTSVSSNTTGEFQEVEVETIIREIRQESVSCEVGEYA